MDEETQYVFHYHSSFERLSSFLQQAEYEDTGELETMLTDSSSDRSTKRLKLFTEVQIFKKNYPQERTAIENNMTSLGKSEDFAKISKMSDDFELSENVIFKYWSFSSNKKNKPFKRVESMTQENVNTVEECMQALYRYEIKCILLIILRLMMARKETVYHARKKEWIMKITNQWLNNNIITSLVKLIEKYGSRIFLRPSGFASRQQEQLHQEIVPLLLETLYHSILHTQVNSDESNEIMLTIHTLFSQTLISNSSHEPLPFFDEKKSTLFQALIALQIIQTRALSYTSSESYLFDRTISKAPYYNHSGNNIQTSSMKTIGASGVHILCRGFSQLVVTVCHGEREGIRNAANNRAFSYIRYCIIPYLQCEDSYNREFRNILIESLSQFLLNLSKRFYVISGEGASVARGHVHSGGGGVGGLFANQAQLHRQQQWDRNELVKRAAVYGDTQTELVDLFAAMGLAFPDFAGSLWGGPRKLSPFMMQLLEPVHQEITEQDNGNIAGNIGNDNNSGIVTTTGDASDLIPVYRLVCGLAGAGRELTIKPSTGKLRKLYVGIFNYLNGARGPRSFWKRIVDKIAHLQREQLKLSPTQFAKFLINNFDITAEMLSALAVTIQSKKLASLLLDAEPKIISSLFTLLTFGVDFRVKGAALHLLASFARSSSPTHIMSIWEEMELLPECDLLDYIRREFDNEREIGVFPLTDGFLVLLSSLLEHASPYYTDAKLGLGVRLPGILRYIDFLVDEVIVRAVEETLSSEEDYDYVSFGQQFRLIARALHIFTIILQLYNINEVKPESFESICDSLLAGSTNNVTRGQASPPEDESEPVFLAADFLELHYSYQCRGKASPASASRPKSAGFTIIGLLLGDSSLLENIFKVFTYFSLKKENYKQLNYAIENATRIIHGFNEVETKYSLRRHEDAAVVEETIMSDIDAAYWLERVYISGIGLLYECAMREDRFLSLASLVGPIKIMRHVDTRPVHQTLLPRPLAHVLCFPHYNYSDEDFPLPIALISHFVCPRYQSNSSNCLCLPSVSSMAISILKHCSANLDANTVTGLLRENERDYDRERDADPHRVGSLRDGCSRALIEGDDYANSSYHYYSIIPAGADPEPLIFTPSHELAFARPLTAELKCALLDKTKRAVGADQMIFPTQAVFGEDGDDFEWEESILEVGSLTTSSSIREAVLDLLLATLHADKLCLAHYLLGIDNIVKSHSHQDRSEPTRAILDPSLYNFPPNACLTTILQLLQTDLIEEMPTLACKCFELTYHLCSSPLTSHAVLILLRNKNIDFFRFHLRRVGNILFFLSQSVAESNTGSSDENNNELNKYIAIQNCMAWLLKICAIEIFTLSRISDAVSDDKFSSILELFYSLEDNTGHHAGLMRDTPPINLIALSLLSCVEEPSHSAIARDVVQEFHTTRSVAFADQKLLRRKIQVPTYGYLPLTLVRPKLQSLLSMDMEKINRQLESDNKLNIYYHMRAVNRHLAQGWRQLVSAVVHGCKERLLLFAESQLHVVDSVRIEAKLRLLVSSIVLPLIGNIVANLSDVVCQEELSRALISLSYAILSSPQQAALTTELLGTLIATLLSVFIEKNSIGGMQGERMRGVRSSAAFRCAMSNVLLLAMQYGQKSKKAESYRIAVMLQLEPMVLPLISILGADASTSVSIADAASVQLRLMAMATLGCTLKTLGSSSLEDERGKEKAREREVRNGSYALLQAISQLMSHNYLRYILETAEFESISSSDRNGDMSGEKAEVLMQATLALCTTIAAGSLEGAEALIDCGIMKKLVDMNKFITSLNAGNSALSLSLLSSKSTSEHLRAVECTFSACLQLLRALSASLPHNLAVNNGAMQFIEKNHVRVMSILSIRDTRLSGLALLESLAALLSLLAAADAPSPLTLQDVLDQAQEKIKPIENGRKSTSSMSLTIRKDVEGAKKLTTSLFESRLGHSADSLTGEICKLLDIIGSNPFPMRRGLYDDTHNESSGLWWSRVHPSPSAEAEMLMHNTDCHKPGMVETADGRWSVFHNVKLALGLQILTHTSTALRHRVKAWLQRDVSIGGNKGILALDILGLGLGLDLDSGNSSSAQGLVGIISKVFNTCAMLAYETNAVRAIEDDNGYINKDDNDIGSDGYPQFSDRQITFKLLHIAENLICVLLDIVLSSSELDVTCWQQTIHLSLQNSVQTALRFDRNTFVYQVGRWIREKLSQIDRTLGHGHTRGQLEELDY